MEESREIFKKKDFEKFGFKYKPGTTYYVKGDYKLSFIDTKPIDGYDVRYLRIRFKDEVIYHGKCNTKEELSEILRKLN